MPDRDWSGEAEVLFRRFAERHSLSIEKIDEPNIELLMYVPAQAGLEFDITLGCQNGDELNIGVDAFWSYFFPFEKVPSTVDRALDGLVSGRARIATMCQLGRPVMRLLEYQVADTWETLHAQIVGIPLPFLRRTISHLSNSASRGAARRN